jgi:hypothetical protein
MSFIIHPPVDAIPPPAKPPGRSEEGWSAAYRAAARAPGQWVPIELPDRVRARNLAFVARKRQRMEAECRGAIVYLKVKVA